MSDTARLFGEKVFLLMSNDLCSLSIMGTSCTHIRNQFGLFVASDSLPLSSSPSYLILPPANHTRHQEASRASDEEALSPHVTEFKTGAPKSKHNFQSNISSFWDVPVVRTDLDRNTILLPSRNLRERLRPCIL